MNFDEQLRRYNERQEKIRKRTIYALLLLIAIQSFIIFALILD